MRRNISNYTYKKIKNIIPLLSRNFPRTMCVKVCECIYKEIPLKIKLAHFYFCIVLMLSRFKKNHDKTVLKVCLVSDFKTSPEIIVFQTDE